MSQQGGSRGKYTHDIWANNSSSGMRSPIGATIFARTIMNMSELVCSHEHKNVIYGGDSEYLFLLPLVLPWLPPRL